MRKSWWIPVVVSAVGLVGCAAGAGSAAPGEAYEAREAATGSNIPSRERRAPTTPEERERARADAEAFRNGQPRPESMPRTR
jgi:hypothetical protein